MIDDGLSLSMSMSMIELLRPLLLLIDADVVLRTRLCARVCVCFMSLSYGMLILTHRA